MLTSPPPPHPPLPTDEMTVHTTKSLENLQLPERYNVVWTMLTRVGPYLVATFEDRSSRGIVSLDA